jgi:energy-coupling factor transporter ATP-binding protein EcfA2
MTQRILVMGLPGSGKTTLANQLATTLKSYGVTCERFNADDVRKEFNDWDFSPEGRLRQSIRMRELADKSTADYAICDFVAPLVEMRDNFAADCTIWMDTIPAGRFEDTNKMFVEPAEYDFRIPEMDAEKWCNFIYTNLLVILAGRPVFDWQKETVLLLGRYQPWHPGHRALFERAVAKTGQVCIMIRDCLGWNGSNPFAIAEVKARIRKDLDPLYQGRYEIIVVPNITNITYGRDVGYKIEQETFDESITSISATQIRKDMGLE